MIREEAERRALGGDGVIAGLLAIIRDLESEIEQKSCVISQWENGTRTKREEVWWYDG